MLRLIRWLTPMVTLGVAIFIVVLLIDVNSSGPVGSIETDESNESSDMFSAVNERRWLDRLAKNEQQGYFYPVNEIYVELDLDQRLVNEKRYRLTARLRDPYQLFCLKQELREHKLHYTLKNEDKGAELLVFSKKEARIKAFLDSLKKYQISASMLPYEEDIQWKNIK